MVTLSERDLGYYIGGTSGSRRDNGLTLFVSSVQWWIQGRGQGDYDYARRPEEVFFKFSLPPTTPPPPPIISGSGSASVTWKALSGRSRS